MSSVVGSEAFIFLGVPKTIKNEISKQLLA
jgi:hypothetical protein